MRAAFKRRVVEELAKHQTTRRLLPSELQQPKAAAPDQEEGGLRENLTWQRAVVDGLLSYADAITAAFDHLSEVHETLLSAGVEAADGAADLAELLADGLQGARDLAESMARKARPELEARRSALAAWADDMGKADFAASEVKRYREKISALRVEESRGSSGEKFVSAEVFKRIKRNQQKLKDAEETSKTASARLQRSLRVCASRRGSLCDLARAVVQGTAEALQRASWPAMQLAEAPDEKRCCSDPEKPWAEEDEAEGGCCNTPGRASAADVPEAVLRGAGDREGAALAAHAAACSAAVAAAESAGSTADTGSGPSDSERAATEGELTWPPSPIDEQPPVVVGVLDGAGGGQEGPIVTGVVPRAGHGAGRVGTAERRPYV